MRIGALRSAETSTKHKILFAGCAWTKISKFFVYKSCESGAVYSLILYMENLQMQSHLVKVISYISLNTISEMQAVKNTLISD